MSTVAQDGPRSVGLGTVFQKGETKIEAGDINALPPLPAGYVPLTGKSYQINTSAQASGPYIVLFTATSVSDEETFKKLRIFHVEPDPFDPDGSRWVDRTDLSSAGSNFKDRTVTSKSEELGIFVICKLISDRSPIKGVADLVLTSTGSSTPVTAPGPVSFTLRVENKGPQAATDVGVLDDFRPDAQFLSATASQGSCKLKGRRIYCKLGNIPVAASATVVITVKPDESDASFPAAGHYLTDEAEARASETDHELDNNSAKGRVLVFPDPNQPPSISIINPRTNTLLVGPADISITAVATDVDGTIRQVEFFDNGKSIGLGQPLGGNRFTLTVRNAGFGRHFLEAFATDNGDRGQASQPAIVNINGPLDLNISSPASDSVVGSGAPLVITVRVNNPSGVINKVEFFSSSMLLGEATKIRGEDYILKINHPARGIYWITAVATDGSGIMTTSQEVTVKVTDLPRVSISSPLNGTRFLAETNLSVAATASQFAGEIEKIDFYANDILIGSTSQLVRNRGSITWRHVKEGDYSVTAVATNDLGVTEKSSPVQIKVAGATGTPGSAKPTNASDSHDQALILSLWR